MFLFLCLLIVSGCSWRWPRKEKLHGLNHDEQHVAPSVIMQKTSTSYLNLFVMFFFFFFFYVLFFSESVTPQKDRQNTVFLEQHKSLSSRAEKYIQSTSPVTGTVLPLTGGGRRGATLVKIQAEIHVEHGESLQEAAVTFHTSNLQNAPGSIWIKSGNQSWTVLKAYANAATVSIAKRC